MLNERTIENDALNKDGLSYGQELGRAVNQEKNVREKLKNKKLPTDNILSQKKEGKKTKSRKGELLKNTLKKGKKIIGQLEL